MKPDLDQLALRALGFALDVGFAASTALLAKLMHSTNMPRERPSVRRPQKVPSLFRLLGRSTTTMTAQHPVTPDGRYFVVRGRLWRMSDPALPAVERSALVKQLMEARRAVAMTRRQGDRSGEDQAHAAVDAAKRALGERGPVWWTNGDPDFNRHMARTSPYMDWFAALSCEAAGPLSGAEATP